MCFCLCFLRDFENCRRWLISLRYQKNHLGMRMLGAKWVPRLLTPEQKLNRVDISKRNPNEFLRRYVTIDET